MFEAKCHCGDIVLTADHIPKTITSCNCSICHRLGALYAYYTAEQVEVMEKLPSNRYQWGDKHITFHSCPTCGCATHYTSTRADGTEMIVINVRMADKSLVDKIPVRYFDGAETWQYIDE